MELDKIIQGDALAILQKLPAESVDCIVTSPPYYGLRDYEVEGQIGSEKTLDDYLNRLLAVTAELGRVLKSTGTFWWNHGDSYGTGSGSGVRNGKQATNRGTQTNEKWQQKGKAALQGYEKSLLLQPYRLAMRMVDDQNWILRNVIIWHKPNAMPHSVKDRFTVDYEPIFFFTKSKQYFFEQQFEAADLRENEYRRALRRKNADDYNLKKPYQGNFPKSFGDPDKRNKRSVWAISTKSYVDAHFAVYPPELLAIPIKAGCPKGGIVLDPFMGSGTTAVVARKLGRHFIGIELNKSYIEIATRRLSQGVLVA